MYISDETRLHYLAFPVHIYWFKNEKAKGCRTSTERVTTILCCASRSGNKERLSIIGKSKNQLCFKCLNKLPVDYYSDSNAGITASIFSVWLMKWDIKLDYKVGLLVDNCAAHIVNSSLKHIKIIFLPTNTTSLMQPCDQGIILNLKA
jgi:hypothetical protein